MKIMGNGHESQSMNSRDQKVIKDDILKSPMNVIILANNNI